MFNAADACTELGIDSAEYVRVGVAVLASVVRCASTQVAHTHSCRLDKRWALAKKANKLVKFGGGFYCAELPRDGKAPIFVFNGFFMSEISAVFEILFSSCCCRCVCFF